MEALTPAKPLMTEFIAKLIDETMEAVVASQASQYKRQNEIKEAILLPLSEFSDMYISASETDEEIISVFKGQSISKDKSFVYETWRFELEQLNVELIDGEDIRKDRLTDIGILKIRAAVKITLGSGKQLLLQQMLKQGIPRIQIDSGEITAKLALDVSQKNKPATSSAKKMLPNERVKSEPEKVHFLSNYSASTKENLKFPMEISVANTTVGLKNEYSEIKLQFRTVYE